MLQSTWVAPRSGQQSPLNYALAEIELGQLCCRFRFSRKWLDHGSSENEVIFPTLASWVEKTHERAALYIERTDIAPLP
jgi:hypothetical protein